MWDHARICCSAGLPQAVRAAKKSRAQVAPRYPIHQQIHQHWQSVRYDSSSARTRGNTSYFQQLHKQMLSKQLEAAIRSQV